MHIFIMLFDNLMILGTSELVCKYYSNYTYKNVELLSEIINYKHTYCFPKLQGLRSYIVDSKVIKRFANIYHQKYLSVILIFLYTNLEIMHSSMFNF